MITIEASSACTFFNPFLPEFIIAAEPLNARDKMLAPGRYSKRACNATSSAFFRPNGSSNDFIVYSCVPEELYVVLVLRHFPRTRMETAFSVEKMDMKLTLECAAQH